MIRTPLPRDVPPAIAKDLDRALQQGVPGPGTDLYLTAAKAALAHLAALDAAEREQDATRKRLAWRLNHPRLARS